MSNFIKVLSKISYKELGRICEEEGLPKSGKKDELVKRIAENLSEDRIREHVIEFLGVGKKVLEHELVPQHRIMSKEEVEELKKKYGIKKWQLPKILHKDPVALLLGAKPGDVLEIKRKSETAGEATYYRLVVRSG